jgi:hypothetical protein
MLLILAWQLRRPAPAGSSPSAIKHGWPQHERALEGEATSSGAARSAEQQQPRPVDARLAHLLLPLTNFSALTTAALLDAGGGAGGDQARRLVRLHQDLFCR